MISRVFLTKDVLSFSSLIGSLKIQMGDDIFFLSLWIVAIALFMYICYPSRNESSENEDDGNNKVKVVKIPGYFNLNIMLPIKLFPRKLLACTYALMTI